MAKQTALALPLGWRHPTDPDCLPTGVQGIDFPRGRISEIAGPASSGRTSLLDSLLATATIRSEHCVLIDTRDSFDPPSAAAYGVRLEKLIWIRCRGNAEHALRAADLVLHSGGFGVIALDLADVSRRCAKPHSSHRVVPFPPHRGTDADHLRGSRQSPGNEILLDLADRNPPPQRQIPAQRGL